MKVLVSGKLHPVFFQQMEKYPEITVTDQPDMSREDLLGIVHDYQAIVTRSETTVDRELIERAPSLKVVARAAVGVGNIDLDFATERGILVFNTPGRNTNSAAEMTMSLLLALVRHLPGANRALKAGGWDRHRFTGIELRGKEIGLVGLGHVGHRVAKFCLGFDMKVHAYDPYVSPQVFERNGATPCASLEELVAKVDILSVHTPLNRETKGLIGRSLLATMRPGSYLLNAARGGIVDEAALVWALDNGPLAGAGIDTFESEPNPLAELVGHDKVVCSPHIGASTQEAQEAIGSCVAQQLIKALRGGVVDHPVNLPEISVIDHGLLKAYAVLAEKLGSMVGQTLNFNPSQMIISYRGDLATLDHSLIKLSFMKGFASQVVDGYVSFVNAAGHVENLGIQISEKDDPQFKSYRSALKVEILGAGGLRMSIGGVVFDETYPKISLLNDFYFEVEPVGDLLVVENEDKVGVIGQLGQFLAQKNVNISSFALSRNQKGGRAMSIISIDSPLAGSDLKELAQIPHICHVHHVSL